MGALNHKNVYVALCAAQGEMEAIVKGSVNPAFKSKYADLADVVRVVRPILSKHGLAFFHQMVDGAAMRTVLFHGESDTSIECAVPLIVAKNDMQGMKSATTYAKRIGLESVTGIAPEDDDGNAAAVASPRPQDAEARAKRETDAITQLMQATTEDAMRAVWQGLDGDVRAAPMVAKAKDEAKAMMAKSADFGDDKIPY